MKSIVWKNCEIIFKLYMCLHETMREPHSFKSLNYAVINMIKLTLEPWFFFFNQKEKEIVLNLVQLLPWNIYQIT